MINDRSRQDFFEFIRQHHGLSPLAAAQVQNAINVRIIVELLELLGGEVHLSEGFPERAGACTHITGTRFLDDGTYRVWVEPISDEVNHAGQGSRWERVEGSEKKGLHFSLWWRQFQPDISFEWPLPNVWLGVSIENRRFVHRAELLRQTPAAVRFISAEPLLGPLTYPYSARLDEGGRFRHHPAQQGPWGDGSTLRALSLGGIDWLIVGGESGLGHRPIDPNWVRDLQLVAAQEGTAFFFKQWGGRRAKEGGRELDGRTWDEIPQVAERAVVR